MLALINGVFAFALVLIVSQTRSSLDKSWLSIPYGDTDLKKGNSSAGNSTNTNTLGSHTVAKGSLDSSTFLIEDEGDAGRHFEKVEGINQVIPFRGTQGRATTGKPSVVTTEEDKKIRSEWGGNCTNYHWLICVNQTTFGNNVYDEETKKLIAFEMDCTNQTLFPPLCMLSGWTVTRCHLLCMSKHCNRDLKFNYEHYVLKDGFCSQ